MKKFLILQLIAISLSVSAENYYISSSTGNNNNNGTSPDEAWETLSKLNSEFYKVLPGDSILFMRNDTLYGKLVLSKSGTSGSPIIISAYGEGADPVISGFTTVTSWSATSSTVQGGNVSCPSYPNMVTINGVNTPMGRYPNTGHLYYESHSGNQSITDNELTNSPNWTGGNVVIRKSPWTIENCEITNHTDNVITFIPFSSWHIERDEQGYFLQNHINALDVFGEWYYDGTKLQVYFGDGGEVPGDYVIKVATIDTLVLSTDDGGAESYISFENLTFEGANICAMYFLWVRNFHINNCTFNFLGRYAIRAQTSSNILVENCKFSEMNGNPINFDLEGKNSIIRNNKITKIGLFPGMIYSDDDGGDGIVIKDIDDIVEYNTLDSIGHCGIRFNNTGHNVHHNFVQHYALTRNDAGGIYTSEAGPGSLSTISDNIILNATGSMDGMSPVYTPNSVIICGIYLDTYSADIEISNNSVAHISGDGIRLQAIYNINLHDNTVYDCGLTILFMEELFPTGNEWAIKNIDWTGNIFVAKESDEWIFYIITSNIPDDIPGFWGTVDNNYYARPVEDDDIARTFTGTNPWPGDFRNLAEWQAYIGKDANSNKSPITIPNNIDIDDYIKFLYNPGDSNHYYDAKENFIDITGKEYGVFSLEPHKSVILINKTDSPQEIENLETPSASSKSPSLSKIIMYPNPAGDIINVLIPGIKDKTTLLLVDIAGRVIYTEEIESEHSLIDISFLSQGIYIALLKGHQEMAPTIMIKN